jgi:hypothetical protein
MHRGEREPAAGRSHRFTRGHRFVEWRVLGEHADRVQIEFSGLKVVQQEIA